jgi:anaerobic selenocysteine-containing dehydrogenase
MKNMDPALSLPKLTRRTFLKASAATAAIVALSDKLLAPSTLTQTTPAQQGNVVVKHGFCHSCHFAKCNVLYTVTNGVLTGVEGDPQGPWNQGMLCVRGNAASLHVYNPYRVKTPLKRTNSQKGLDVDPGWVEISWDEAVNTLAQKLGAIRKDDPRTLLWFTGFPSLFSIVTGLAGVFPGVFGTPNSLGPTGALCSVHLSNGLVHGGFVHWPDFEYAKYLIALRRRQRLRDRRASTRHESGSRRSAQLARR